MLRSVVGGGGKRRNVELGSVWKQSAMVNEVVGRMHWTVHSSMASTRDSLSSSCECRNASVPRGEMDDPRIAIQYPGN
jgi:hypothetical protein